MSPAPTTPPSPRLDGLDLARFGAFVGMVVVNFNVVMGTDEGSGLLHGLTAALEGRAAATFVVLAGIGLGLSARRARDAPMDARVVNVTLRRAAFLLVLGLLNSLVFDADIVHYYAFYFMIGALLLPLRSHWLLLVMAMLNVAFVAMVLVLDYDAGWNWEDYSYAGFWTPTGFVRNLFFNGWHPVVPWLGFFLLGMVLGRTSLSQVRTQHRLILLGAAAFIGAEVTSSLATAPLLAIDPELGVFATTAPVPPMPLYLLAGSGAACMVIGLCLRCSRWLDERGVLGIVTPAGRQALTLYVAHVLLGMGTLEAFGMLEGQSLPTSVSAALLFCGLSVVYAWGWSRRFKRGPIEAAMRVIAG